MTKDIQQPQGATLRGILIDTLLTDDSMSIDNVTLDSLEQQVRQYFAEQMPPAQDGKRLLDIGSEFATPRDYRRAGFNAYHDQAQRVILGGRDERD